MREMAEIKVFIVVCGRIFLLGEEEIGYDGCGCGPVRFMSPTGMRVYFSDIKSLMPLRKTESYIWLGAYYVMCNANMW